MTLQSSRVIWNVNKPRVSKKRERGFVMEEDEDKSDYIRYPLFFNDDVSCFGLRYSLKGRY